MGKFQFNSQDDEDDFNQLKVKCQGYLLEIEKLKSENLELKQKIIFLENDISKLNQYSNEQILHDQGKSFFEGLENERELKNQSSIPNPSNILFWNPFKEICQICPQQCPKNRFKKPKKPLDPCTIRFSEDILKSSQLSKEEEDQVFGNMFSNPPESIQPIISNSNQTEKNQEEDSCQKQPFQVELEGSKKRLESTSIFGYPNIFFNPESIEINNQKVNKQASQKDVKAVGIDLGIPFNLPQFDDRLFLNKPIQSFYPKLENSEKSNPEIQTNLERGLQVFQKPQSDFDSNENGLQDIERDSTSEKQLTSSDSENDAKNFQSGHGNIEKNSNNESYKQ